MKKFIWLIILLATAGIIISAILLYQYYYPLHDIAAFSCGTGAVDSCISVLQSKYAAVFGIPNSLLGIYFYSVILFLILIADYAKGEYFTFISSILFIAVAMALVFDIYLATMLIVIREAYTFCIVTYIINIALFLVLYIFIKDNRINVIKALLKAPFAETNTTDKKAALASMLLFTIMLLLAILATGHVIKLEAAKDKAPLPMVQQEINKFYSQKVENIKYIDGLVVGNKKAKIKIHVFTDLLCTACFSFYRIEKYIISKYKNKVAVIYHHFPLDKKCNKQLKRSIYKNSCLASKAILLAQEYNIAQKYLFKHFENYQKYNYTYSVYNIIQNLKELNLGIDINKIKADLKKEKIQKKLQAQISFANSIKINATPTIFIGNRRILGSVPKEILDEIIKIELIKR